MGNKLIFYIRGGFGYGFEVGTYIPITHPVPCFQIGENSKPMLKPSQDGKTRQIEFGLGGYPRAWFFVSMPSY